MPVPWTVGDHALPDPGLIGDATASSSGEASPAAAINESFFTALGQKLVVKVLILPDYVAPGPRVAETGAMWRELQQVMPQYELSTCQCVGPFVDDFGHAAFFYKSKKYGENQIHLEIQQDLLTSVAAVLRSITTHYPDIAHASPMLLEVGLAARNFKLPELRAIAPAWARVKQIVAIKPRLARKDKIGPMFKDIAPELYDKELVKSASNSEDSRWSHAPLMGVLPRNYLDPSADDLF